MQVLTTLVVSIMAALKAAGLWLLGSAELIAATVIGVLSSTGFWIGAAVVVVVASVIGYMVAKDRILLVG